MGLAVHGSILYPIMGDRCTPARGPMDMEDPMAARGIFHIHKAKDGGASIT